MDNRTDHTNGQPVYQPTEDDIREACEALQAGWSEAEHRRRAGYAYQSDTTPPDLDREQRRKGFFGLTDI
jgi:hypothetical protein